MDAYEIPDRLRNQVDRTRHTAAGSPGAAAKGVFDIDHIDPYIPTSTTADHRARPTPPTPPGCAGSTTG